MENSLRQGQLIKWKGDRGFGFIQPADGSREVFLHISQIKDATRRPQVNDTIYYYVVVENDGKVRADNAFILGARSKPASSSAPKATSSSPFPVWELLLLSILPLTGSINFALTIANPLPLILYPVMSLITFAAYADDKARAKRGDWRISEKMLHLCELAGGWLGAFVAQRRLRHKSSKKLYQVVFWAIVFIHTVFWLDWFFLGKNLSQEFINNISSR